MESTFCLVASRVHQYSPLRSTSHATISLLLSRTDILPSCSSIHCSDAAASCVRRAKPWH
ncbi:hypothetical protein EXIGLDRAFT_221313 [Exidia glandulosa HHB12029]|uniref:Uncharacterized protein n=1 Tax=Exidia glandulosa HHB12029 TaxID=1314781 RepID=A0A165MQV8_EXIGL|nr:hypothetical protein EXIGLDRAFT_221313 [Exidia glandulosa HHB12029]